MSLSSMKRAFRTSQPRGPSRKVENALAVRSNSSLKIRLPPNLPDSFKSSRPIEIWKLLLEPTCSTPVPNPTPRQYSTKKPKRKKTLLPALSSLPSYQGDDDAKTCVPPTSTSLPLVDQNSPSQESRAKTWWGDIYIEREKLW